MEWKLDGLPVMSKDFERPVSSEQLYDRYNRQQALVMQA
ncbi:hypothetical protein BSY239_3399 [Hydrogenophaga sp. RAC07]|nr:hypothetical protein BSY239_3399 [Hydrogenophaga sp. RAC07]